MSNLLHNTQTNTFAWGDAAQPLLNKNLEPMAESSTGLSGSGSGRDDLSVGDVRMANPAQEWGGQGQGVLPDQKGMPHQLQQQQQSDCPQCRQECPKCRQEQGQSMMPDQRQQPQQWGSDRSQDWDAGQQFPNTNTNTNNVKLVGPGEQNLQGLQGPTKIQDLGLKGLQGPGTSQEFIQQAQSGDSKDWSGPLSNVDKWGPNPQQWATHHSPDDSSIGQAPLEAHHERMPKVDFGNQSTSKILGLPEKDRSIGDATLSDMPRNESKFSSIPKDDFVGDATLSGLPRERDFSKERDFSDIPRERDFSKERDFSDIPRERDFSKERDFADIPRERDFSKQRDFADIPRERDFSALPRERDFSKERDFSDIPRERDFSKERDFSDIPRERGFSDMPRDDSKFSSIPKDEPKLLGIPKDDSIGASSFGASQPRSLPEDQPRLRAATPTDFKAGSDSFGTSEFRETSKIRPSSPAVLKVPVVETVTFTEVREVSIPFGTPLESAPLENAPAKQPLDSVLLENVPLETAAPREIVPPAPVLSEEHIPVPAAAPGQQDIFHEAAKKAGEFNARLESRERETMRQYEKAELEHQKRELQFKKDELKHEKEALKHSEQADYHRAMAHQHGEAMGTEHEQHLRKQEELRALVAQHTEEMRVEHEKHLRRLEGLKDLVLQHTHEMKAEQQEHLHEQSRHHEMMKVHAEAIEKDKIVAEEEWRAAQLAKKQKEEEIILKENQKECKEFHQEQVDEARQMPGGSGMLGGIKDAAQSVANKAKVALGL